MKSYERMHTRGFQNHHSLLILTHFEKNWSMWRTGQPKRGVRTSLNNWRIGIEKITKSLNMNSNAIKETSSYVF